MYPQTNAVRSVRDLSGVWDFRFNANEPWQPIAVPASYNDQSPDPEFHYGMAYYRTTFTVPEGARRVLRFDAVTHNAVVRLNGQEIVTHRGGFLPFEADITALAKPGDTVTAGQKLGTVGTISCECAEEAHIHLEVLQNGQYLDPAKIS